jgi:outer membrane lipoprotein-sorting protein
MRKATAIIFVVLLTALGARAQNETPKTSPDSKPEGKPAATPATPAAPASASATTTTAPAATTTPTAEQLVDKYVAALGGKAAIEKLTSITAKGTFDLPAMGVSGTAERLSKAPNKSYFIVNIPSFGDVKQGTDGTTAWAQNPGTGQIDDVTGVELTRSKISADFYRDLKLKEHYPKMTVKGTGKVGERDAYVVEAVSSAGPSTMYFDSQSGLVLRVDGEREGPEGKMMVEEYFDDYREVDGVKFPFYYRQKNPQYDFTVKYSEVKHNVAIDDAKFSKPAN